MCALCRIAWRGRMPTLGREWASFASVFPPGRFRRADAAAAGGPAVKPRPRAASPPVEPCGAADEGAAVDNKPQRPLRILGDADAGGDAQVRRGHAVIGQPEWPGREEIRPVQ